MKKYARAINNEYTIWEDCTRIEASKAPLGAITIEDGVVTRLRYTTRLLGAVRCALHRDLTMRAE